MRTEIINGHEVTTDGDTVWINGRDGCNVARFGRGGADLGPHTFAPGIKFLTWRYVVRQALHVNMHPSFKPDWCTL